MLLKQVVEIPDKKSNMPLYGLLTVQLITGLMLMPMNNFLGIFLNEVHSFPMRRVARVIALGQVVGMVASFAGGGLSDHIGKKKVLTLGVAALAVCSTLYFSPEPWLVLILWGIGGLGLIVLIGYNKFITEKPYIHALRNFYGRLTIKEKKVSFVEGKKRNAVVLRSLIDGQIEHGSQILDPRLRLQPTIYFSVDGGIGVAVMTS